MTPSKPFVLLVLAFAASAIGLVVSVYQSLDVWGQLLRGERFEGLSGPDTKLQYVQFFLLLAVPLALTVYSIRRWHLKVRGFALLSTVTAAIFPAYAGLCIAILYGYSA
jgi:hypothetical protein